MICKLSKMQRIFNLPSKKPGKLEHWAKDDLVIWRISCHFFLKFGFQTWKLQKPDLPKNSSRAQFADSHDKNWVHQFTTLVSPPFWVHKLLSVSTQTVHRAISTRQHCYQRSNFSFLRQQWKKKLWSVLFKLDSERNIFTNNFM